MKSSHGLFGSGSSRLQLWGLVSIAVMALVAVWVLIRTCWPAETLIEQVLAAFSEGRYSDAQRLSEESVAKDPAADEAWMILAESASRNREYIRSCEALEESARRRGRDVGRLAIRLGRDWMMKNLAEPASRAFRVAEEDPSLLADTLRLEAQIAAVTGHSIETTRCIMERLKLRAVTRGEMQLVTSIAPSINDPDRLNALLQADPTNPSPLLVTVINQLNVNENESALHSLLRITAARPDDVEAQAMLGEVYSRFHPERFLDWHAKLPEACRDHARIWANRGRWLADAGHPHSAIRCLREATVREPENMAVTVLLGQLLKSVNFAELGNQFSLRGYHLQRVIDLNSRMSEPRHEEIAASLVEELISTGRLWEAWGWCTVQIQSGSPDETIFRQQLAQIEPELHATLPRTRRSSVPGAEMDWNQFPLPDWAAMRSTSTLSQDAHGADLSKIKFLDRTEEVGIDFRFVNSYSAEEGRKIFESMGGGVAVADFDLDTWPDFYFPQGNSSPTKTDTGPSDQLYRNLQGERFVDVTTLAGIQETSYSQGVAAGDYDNDGFPDLYIANLGRNCLLRNQGDGTFVDATEEAGLTQSSWTVSCAIADLNGDSLPDLFDVNYVQGKELLTGFCLDSYQRRTVCRPTVYEPTFNTVCINQGNGRFVEQQAECGLDLPRGMGLGLVVADFNEDGKLDVFVANDMTANFLLINDTNMQSSLHFTNEAILRGVAFDKMGHAQACMGIACSDLNHDGSPDLFVTNFAKESNTLYVSQAEGFYQDETQSARLREPSFEPLGFGTQFLDANNDGLEDLVVMNGHIDQFVDQQFQMKPQFFRGLPNLRYQELISPDSHNLFNQPRLGRGLAVVDWNRDGKIDFVASDLEAPVLLAENRSDSRNRSLRLRLVGTRSSRDAIGAKVTVTRRAGDDVHLQLTAGDGYESSNERVLRVGVGELNSVERITIRWPSGAESHSENLSVDHEWLVIEEVSQWHLRR